MIQIPVTITVALSKQITSRKDGKKYVAIEGMLMGVGVFKMLVAEGKVPDDLEGKTCKAIFSLGVDKNLNPSLRFVGIDGYVGGL